MLARQHKLYTLSRGVFASHNSFHTVTPLSAHYFFNDFSPWLKRGGGGGRGGGEARKPPSGPSPISASRLCARAPALGAAAASARLPARPSCTPRGTGGGGGRAPQLCAAPSLAVGCCCLCRAQRLPCAVFFFLFVGGAGGLCLFWAAALCGSGHAGVARAGPARLAHTYPTVRAMMEHNVRWPHPCVLAVPVGLLLLGKRRRAPVRATLFSGGATAAVSAYVGMHFWRTFPDDLLCLPSAPRFHPPPPAPRFLCAARAWSPPLCSCVWALALFPPSLSAC